MAGHFDRLLPLSQQELELIHQKTVEILSTTGMWFESAKARDFLHRHGQRVEGETVYFSEPAIMAALKNIPAKFSIVARNPAHSREIGGANFALAPSGGAAYILDSSGQCRLGSKADYIKTLKLTQALTEIDLNAELVAGSDFPPDQPLWKLLAAIEYTDKPVNLVDIGGGGLLGVLFGLDQATMNRDALAGKVYGLRYVNPVSPLGLSEAESDRLFDLCTSGIAVAISPMPIAGMTAPCTLPGLLISQNCEIIGTMVLAQLINPGCPLLYGCIGSIANMRNASAPIGTPETRKIEMAAAQIAGYYGLPTRGNAGLTDANSVDYQAGGEAAFQFVNSLRSGLNVMSGMGAMASWNAGSMEKMVLDAELAGYMRRFFKPLEFNDDSMAVEVIKKVGPRGAYIAEEHTFAHFRQEFYPPQVFNRLPFDLWQKAGAQDAWQMAGLKVEELVAGYVKPDLEKSLLQDLTRYVEDYYSRSGGH